MTSLRKILASLVVAGSTIAAVPAVSGCYGTGTLVVEDVPPPPREEIVVSRPGHIWVHGHWMRPGRTWVWRGGYYERERSDQVYVEGRWERRGRGHVWIDGGWRARAGVSVR